MGGTHGPKGGRALFSGRRGLAAVFRSRAGRRFDGLPGIAGARESLRTQGLRRRSTPKHTLNWRFQEMVPIHSPRHRIDDLPGWLDPCCQVPAFCCSFLVEDGQVQAHATAHATFAPRLAEKQHTPSLIATTPAATACDRGRPCPHTLRPPRSPTSQRPPAPSWRPGGGADAERLRPLAWPAGQRHPQRRLARACTWPALGGRMPVRPDSWAHAWVRDF